MELMVFCCGYQLIVHLKDTWDGKPKRTKLSCVEEGFGVVVDEGRDAELELNSLLSARKKQCKC